MLFFIMNIILINQFIFDDYRISKREYNYYVKKDAVYCLSHKLDKNDNIDFIENKNGKVNKYKIKINEKFTYFSTSDFVFENNLLYILGYKKFYLYKFQNETFTCIKAIDTSPEDIYFKYHNFQCLFFDSTLNKIILTDFYKSTISDTQFEEKPINFCIIDLNNFKTKHINLNEFNGLELYSFTPRRNFDYNKGFIYFSDPFGLNLYKCNIESNKIDTFSLNFNLDYHKELSQENTKIGVDYIQAKREYVYDSELIYNLHIYDDNNIYFNVRPKGFDAEDYKIYNFNLETKISKVKFYNNIEVNDNDFISENNFYVPQYYNYLNGNIIWYESDYPFKIPLNKLKYNQLRGKIDEFVINNDAFKSIIILECNFGK